MCTLPALRSRPDFFLSEEVTCTLPSGTELHVGVYDNTERDHVETARRRTDFESFAAYLGGGGRFFSANHVISSLTGRRALEDFLLFESAFPALETRNGHMLARANENVAAMAAAPLALAMPAVTLGNYVVEQIFARCWMSRYRRLRAARGRNVAAAPIAEAA